MKIGIVVGHFGGVLKGGAEVQAYNTIEELKKLGMIVVHITHETSLKELKTCQLVHFFKSDNYFSILAEVLVNNNIPYVVSSIFFPESKISFFKNLFVRKLTVLFKLEKLIGRFYLWDHAKLIFPNTYDELTILEKLNISQIKLKRINNAIENDYLDDNISYDQYIKNYPELQNKKYILNVGRIESRKRQYNLIRTCKILDIDLVIIGDIRDHSYWKKCKDLNFDKLTLIPFSDNKDFLKSAYQHAAVFALPSTMETPGLTALEAYSQGTNIVVTQVGGARDYFSNDALYCDPEDDKTLENAIKISLESSRKQTINIHTFSYKSVAQEYIQYYQDIIYA